ncbi:MAG: hypothetical protein WCI21_09325 [Alphaproteobacteria bacterium]
MSLEDLARSRPFAKPLAVPAWTLGCFKRRCITYATGVEDCLTEVIWVQSHGLTGDLRIPASRQRPAGTSLGDCSAQELAELAKAEGFAAQTRWADGVMSWDGFASFQPYDKWPEPGRLERVGASLIEWAPSGIYVEDWRMQPGSDGLSVGLRLETETGFDGRERARQGALVIAGRHALRVIGRWGELPERPLHEQAAAAADATGLARTIFETEISYGTKTAGGYQIERSVNPFVEDSVMFRDEAFERGEDIDVLIETSRHGQPWTSRKWRIDTLLAGQARPVATPAAAEGLAWLERESPTLL